MQDFSGLWIPLVTPFAGGAVDHAALKRLVIHLGEYPIAGFVACGSTGEAALLSAEETEAVLDTIEGAGRRPLVLGVSGATSAEVIAALRRVAPRSFRGFLVPPPAYLRPSQEGLRRFFREVADAAPKPLIVYDVPARTGVRVELPTLLDLAAHPNIRAVKDCSGDLPAAEAVIRDGRLQLLCGDDERWFTLRCLGASGAIAASAHLRTDLFAALDRHLAAGELHAAQMLWHRLGPLTRALFEEPNPAPAKGALARQGWIRNELREPMQPASPAVLQRVEALLAGLPRAAEAEGVNRP